MIDAQPSIADAQLDELDIKIRFKNINLKWVFALLFIMKQNKAGNDPASSL